MMLSKHQEIKVNYRGTNFVCIENKTLSEKRYALYDQSKDKIVLKSNNPMDFDEIVFKNKY